MTVMPSTFQDLALGPSIIILAAQIIQLRSHVAIEVGAGQSTRICVFSGLVDSVLHGFYSLTHPSPGLVAFAASYRGEIVC